MTLRAPAFAPRNAHSLRPRARGAARTARSSRTARGVLGVLAVVLVVAAWVAAGPGADAAPLVAPAPAAEPPAAAAVAARVAAAWSAGLGGEPAGPVPDEPAAAPRERVPAPAPFAAADPATIAACVQALRDDDIPHNALRALGDLIDQPPGRIDELEAALQSADLQQRTLAGVVLRLRVAAGVAAASDELLAGSVAALRSDVRVNVAGTAAYPLAATSVRFLVGHAAAAHPPLVRALDGGDAQQRFLAAWLLAIGGAGDRMAHRLVRELVARVGDNTVRGDALMAAHGLYRLGPAALPALREWRGAVDAQGRAVLELVELDLVDPPRDLAALRTRTTRQRVTRLYHDPALEFDVRRSLVPTW